MDGVCHQAANRILYAAGNGALNVAAARGYALSLTLYGTYGLGTTVPWPRLSHCATLHAGAERLTGAPNVSDDKSAQFTKSIRDIHSRPNADGLTVARQELEALARAQLGQDYDQRKIDAVADLQRVWRQKQRHFTERLKRGELSPEGYRHALRQIVSEMAAQCEQVLGDKDFERLFGVPAKDAADLLSIPVS